MKILISESQLNNIILNEAPLSQQTINYRLKRAKELAVNYPNPRQFELKHKKLWNFLRQQKLVDDVFPNRQKYREDLTPEQVIRVASKFINSDDFHTEYPVEWNYAYKNNMINDLFPDYNSDSGIKLWSGYMGSMLGTNNSPYYNENIQKYLDYLMDRAGQYNDMEDMKIRNPKLYKQLSDLGHDYVPSDEDVHY